MEASASLKQTVTHLFDAVRFSNHAKELDQAATKAEENLEVELSRLDSHVEEFTNQLDSMKNGAQDAVVELCSQVEEFLETAKHQATEKLQNRTKEQVEEFRGSSASERDKALKSLEAYLASDPLPLIENVVQIRLTEGAYEARSKYECEGGMKYDFRLATQNSTFFNKEFFLSQLGYELKIPVRLSRTLLKKASVPGFERLDQYVLESAETSGGRVRATFHKEGNDARIKVVTSGSDPSGFVGIDYTDQTQQVNVMTDPSLSAHVDVDLVKRAMGELATGFGELSQKRVALLSLSLGNGEALENIDCQKVLQFVLKSMGPAYQVTVRKIVHGTFDGDSDLSLDLIRERLKVLGPLSANVTIALGLQGPG
jgi:hypothetical protein